MSNLNWLLNPLSKEDFYNRYWQVKPKLLASNRLGYYGNLFGFEEFEMILEYSQPQPPTIRVTSISESGNISVPYLTNGRLDLDQIRNLYFNGKTIILNSIEDFSPRIAKLVKSIQNEMSFRVQANAYLTPESSQGFNPHYDTHDVLVVQIEGKKNWRIYDQNIKSPLHRMTDGAPINSVDESSKFKTFELIPGDLLYIPRGWVHEAKSVDQSSLHITLGVHVTTGRDLLMAALDNICYVDPRYREALPVGFLNNISSYEKCKTTYDLLINIMKNNDIVYSALKNIEDSFIRLGRTAGDGKMFSSLNQINQLTLDTIIKKKSYLHNRIVPIEGKYGLQFSNSIITFSTNFLESIEFITKNESCFKINDLPNLNDQEKLEIVSHLVKDGFLSIVPKFK